MHSLLVVEILPIKVFEIKSMCNLHSITVPKTFIYKNNFIGPQFFREKNNLVNDCNQSLETGKKCML